MCFLHAHFYIKAIQFLNDIVFLNFLISTENRHLEPQTIRNDDGDKVLTVIWIVLWNNFKVKKSCNSFKKFISPRNKMIWRIL